MSKIIIPDNPYVNLKPLLEELKVEKLRYNRLRQKFKAIFLKLCDVFHKTPRGFSRYKKNNRDEMQ